MPRKSVPKTSTERSRKSREISALNRDLQLMEEILVQSDLPKKARNFLESTFRKKFNCLQKMRGLPGASGEWKGSCYISQKDRTLRQDQGGIHSNESLIREGFVSGSAGVLVGAGPVPNTDVRLRTPEWLLNTFLLGKYRDELYQRRPKTAEKDLLSLVAYYLFRESNQDIFNKYYSRQDPDGPYHRGEIRLDSTGGYTNVATYRNRLVRLGYQWLGIPVPTSREWDEFRKQVRLAAEAQRARKQLRASIEDPVAYEKGEVGGKLERDFGYIHQKEVLSLEREDEQRIATFQKTITKRTRDRRREKARRGLPSQAASQDRELTRILDLIQGGRIRHLHTLLVPTSTSRIENVIEMQRPEARKAA